MKCFEFKETDVKKFPDKKNVHKSILKKQAYLCIMPTLKGMREYEMMKALGVSVKKEDLEDIFEKFIDLLFDNWEKTEEEKKELYEQEYLKMIQTWSDKSEQERVGWVQQETRDWLAKESLKFDVPELVERVPRPNKRKSLRRPGVSLPQCYRDQLRMMQRTGSFYQEKKLTSAGRVTPDGLSGSTPKAAEF